MEEFKTVTVIPPNPKYDKRIRNEHKMLNVAAYCRVSTRFEQQENSYEAQISYYSRKIESNKNWNYVGIYADEGKAATATKSRDSFNNMIEDCYAGKIDLILTKSISRFARNTVDCLRIIRELKDRQVRILFEKENIDTMDSSGELLITILSSQAQEESRNLSENTRWGIIRKFEQGIVQVNHTKFLGYTKNADEKLIIVPEEAAIVKRIFDLYLQGLGTYKIARALESEEIRTTTGKEKWHHETIYKMLQCEKYMGDAILQKTYTIDFLTKKRVMNNGYVKKYYVRNSHEAIITKEQFYLVQEEMKRRSCASERSTRKRYSSAYPLSGLIICGKCSGTYNRVTWQNKGGKSFVWRCRERLKAGTVQCKQSATIRESEMMKLLSKLFNAIIKTDPADSTVYLIKTKAVLIVSLEDKEEFEEVDITKQLLNKVIDRIVVKDEKTATVHFKSGLTMEKTLS
ncbi:recombinase family protein [Anaerosolibacter sp.]|uniref:recombinase family protein n=1 Tax=Anaerosolibacter sp. TaxID=1872527 RepID=UPI0039EFBDF7